MLANSEQQVVPLFETGGDPQEALLTLPLGQTAQRSWRDPAVAFFRTYGSDDSNSHGQTALQSNDETN